MKKRKWMALLLCLMLPVRALAVTEGEVEQAPMVDTQLDNWQTQTYYLPDASYYGSGEREPAWAESDTWVESEMDTDGYYRSTTQNPRLTAGEIRRAQKLSEAYDAGKAAYTGESVLEKMDGVIVGVYALDPLDFDGERAYVLLPGTCLTDEQLLSIIAAYDEMGLIFDPTSLNYRNCSRGGGIEASRFMSDEERQRYNYLAECIRLGKLILPEGGMHQPCKPLLASAYFCGMSDFSLMPYRRMTDEEMVALLVSNGVHDERGEIDHAAVEAKSRNALHKAFACPLSMKLAYLYTEGSYVPAYFTERGEIGYDSTTYHPWHGASFSYLTPEGVRVSANAAFDKESGRLTSLAMTHENPYPDSQPLSPSEDVAQNVIDTTIAQVETELGLSGLQWQTRWEDRMFTKWGNCIPVRAVVAENWLLTVHVGSDDGLMHGLELSFGTMVDELPEMDIGENG